MAKETVLVINRFDELALSELTYYGYNLVHYKGEFTDEAIAAYIQDMEQQPAAIMVRAAPIREKTINAAGEALKIIVRGGSDTASIDKAYAASKGIPVCNTLDTNADAVALHTVYNILEGLTNINSSQKQAAEAFLKSPASAFQNKHLFGFDELGGKKIAVLGVGFIGEKVITQLATTGAEVHVYSRSFDEGLAEFINSRLPSGRVVAAKSVIEATTGAHALTFHMPLDPGTKDSKGTKGIVQREHLLSLAPGAVIVNSCQADLMDIHAAAELLDSGQIKHLYLDAFQVDYRTGKLFPISRPIEAAAQAPADSSTGRTVKVDVNKNATVTPLIYSETGQADKKTTSEAAKRITTLIDKKCAVSCVNPAFTQNSRIDGATYTAPPQPKYKTEYNKKKRKLRPLPLSSRASETEKQPGQQSEASQKPSDQVLSSLGDLTTTTLQKEKEREKEKEEAGQQAEGIAPGCTRVPTLERLEKLKTPEEPGAEEIQRPRGFSFKQELLEKAKQEQGQEQQEPSLRRVQHHKMPTLGKGALAQLRQEIQQEGHSWPRGNGNGHNGWTEAIGNARQHHRRYSLG